MRLGVPKEVFPGERRVAATPETVKKLKDLGFTVVIERGAGEGASFSDAAYEQAGAELSDAPGIWGGSDLVIKVRPPTLAEADTLKEGATLISFIWKLANPELVERLAARKANVLAMEMIPRTTRAQKMDALSSTANLVGYRAVIEAAAHFGSFFTQQITAAGKVPPAKILIIGAGVAGLACIGTARGLGAVVRAFDTRPAVREQVQSMGAEFLEVQIQEDADGGGGYAKEMSPAFIEAEMALFAAQAKEVDIVITTALIPNKPAPKLWLKSHVEAMKPGSVIIDLASEQGGNCDLTVKDQVVVHNGVKVVGFTDYPSRLSGTASQLYGMNLVHLLTDLGGGTKWNVNLEDEIIRGASLIHKGELLPPAAPINPSPAKPAAPKPAAAAPAAAAAAPAPAPSAPAKSHGGHGGHGGGGSGEASPAMKWVGIFLLVAWLGLRFGVNPAGAGDMTGAATFLQHLTVFVLACFIGWQVVWNVTPALHTPLMSVTNAISGIILVGGMLQTREPLGAAAWLGTAAILLATINIAGGFLVTQRMLKMFRK